MTLTAIVGALMALAVRAKPEPDPIDDRIGKLAAEVEALGQSQARLLDYNERLERQLAMQESLTAHWKEQAQLVARNARREQESACLQAQAQMQQYQAMLNPQSEQNYNALAQHALENLRNCVPSRSQVWGAQGGLVHRLNRLDG